ncbi:MAG: type II secretion system F family protein [Bacilli bacterium]|nr:type II secretion system F family protein [Bacilli bacterium]MDD4282790.1 type II secretion system F family protein [Bacilli bacterium]MDD4719149.1 type II secretion system F family protein [Bacilli bacterium]
MHNTRLKNKVIRKIYRDIDIYALQQKLDLLGNLNAVDAVKYMNTRLIIIVSLFLGILFTFKMGYIYAPIATVILYYIYDYICIDRKLKIRTSLLDREALQFFEILTLTLESGRNLEHALEITCFNVDSNISREFKKALMEMKFGKSLLEALDNIKKRVPSETINNIILNITQTNVFGNSILETMYNQIDFLREKQILEIKERINKIPNKVSIISVIFVIPLILLLILGPFIINILS